MLWLISLGTLSLAEIIIVGLRTGISCDAVQNANVPSPKSGLLSLASSDQAQNVIFDEPVEYRRDQWGLSATAKCQVTATLAKTQCIPRSQQRHEH
jgi:hypothetical protein